LLDSGTTSLVMSSEFTRKQFKLNKIKRPIHMRNANSIFNKKEPIENTVEINIFYKGYKKRTEIDVIGG